MYCAVRPLMYDGDVSTYDASGKVYEVIYAEEAPKQGAPICALTTGDETVIIASVGQTSPLCMPQPKVFEVENNILMGISGIYSDAKKDVATSRALSSEHRLRFETGISALELVEELASQAQERTQISSSRPHGVGVIFAAFEEGQSLVYYTSPTAEYRQFKALAVGRNAQAANAFLVRSFTAEMQRQEAIELGVRALQKAVGEELKAIEVWTVGASGCVKHNGEQILTQVEEKYKEVEDADSD